MKYPQSYPQGRCVFDRHFLHHVLPRLELTVLLGAALTYNNLELFSDASSRVMAVACRLGATSLSSRTLEELRDWIDLRLLEAIDRPPPPWLVTPARLARITGEPRQPREGNDERGNAEGREEQWQWAAD